MISWLKSLLGTHPASDEDLSGLVDGRVAFGARAGLEAHIAGCDACRGKLAELRSLKAMLESLPQVEPLRSFALTPDLAAQGRPTQSRGSSSRLAFAPALALSALVLLLAVDFAVIGGESGNEGLDFAQPALQKAASESDNAGALPPPATGGRADALAPNPPATTDAGAPTSQADKAAATPAPALEDRAGAGRPGETGVPPAETAAAERDQQPERTIVRFLEVIAALALAGSAGYFVLRSSTGG